VCCGCSSSVAAAVAAAIAGAIAVVVVILSEISVVIGDAGVCGGGSGI
jgi:hypothetical protein